MRNQVVEIPSIKDPIKRSPGFAKKALSDYKLDILGLCGFGCRYCSSNHGNYLRINRQAFAETTEQQIGTRLLPAEDPGLMFVWPDVLERLETQLDRRNDVEWGNGQTLVFSMLTDGFSPEAVRRGLTKRALDLLVERTSFRIRILTKNAIVGTDRWLRYFSDHRDRFVVGLSIGTLNARWVRSIEVGTSSPQARVKALNRLQDAQIPTYGMLCPVFPDVLVNDQLEDLISQVSPNRVEHLWAEPYNDRNNWEVVRAGYGPRSFGYKWFTDVYEDRTRGAWSAYATELYSRLRAKAAREGWLQKLRYLLYEVDISESDATKFSELEGVLLQSAPSKEGYSSNPHIAKYQHRGGAKRGPPTSGLRVLTAE